MNSEAGRVPTHFWIVSVVSLLWNAFGGYDYVMTQTKNADYLAQFTEGQRAYFEAFPTWMEAAWAVGVWGSVAGSLLLLMRSRHSVTAFILSLAGLAASSVYAYGIADLPPDMTSGTMIAMNAVIWAGVIFFLVYSHRMRQRGVLR